MAKEFTQVVVLRDFPVYDDGIHPRDLVAGETDKVPSDLLDGLVGEGFVRLPDADQATMTFGDVRATESIGADIPDNWRELHHKQIVKLAKSIGADVDTKEPAIAAIEAYLVQKAA